MQNFLKLKNAARIALVMLVLVALVGCFAQTAVEPPSAEDLEVPEFNETALQNISASSEPGAVEAYGFVFTGSIFQLAAVSIVQATVEGWDESQPASYTEGFYTISWTESGGVWTWTTEYDDGVESFTSVITVEAVDDGWTLDMSYDGVSWMSGTLNDDGSTGQVTLFGTGDASNWVVTWDASSLDGFDQTYTVQYNDANGELAQELVSHYTTDGTSGQWEYTDYLDNSNSGSGSW